MSILTVDIERGDLYRTFDEKESFPNPWEEVGVKSRADKVVVVPGHEPITLDKFPPLPEVIEGVGFLMLTSESE